MADGIVCGTADNVTVLVEDEVLTAASVTKVPAGDVEGDDAAAAAAETTDATVVVDGSMQTIM